MVQFNTMNTFPQWNWGAGSLPNFNTFGNFNQFGMFPTFGSSFGTNNTADSEEQRIQSYLKKREAEEKTLKEYNEQLAKIEQEKQIIDKKINAAKTGKVSADGIIMQKESLDDYNKLSFGKKALRALSGMLTGNIKLATSFIGYETDPKTGQSKWNPLKCLKNAAIAGACIGLTMIPYVGPYITVGLLTTGVISGVVGTAKGVVSLANAKTVEDIDNGWQDIGAGLTIGVTSALGIRGLKGAGAGAGTASAASKGAEVGTAIENGAKSSWISKIGTKFCNFGKGIKDFPKDYMSAWKAASAQSKTQAALVKSNGFMKTWGDNIAGMIPKLGKTKFAEEKANAIQKIDNQLTAVENRMNALQTEYNANPAQNHGLMDEITLLEKEQALLNAQKVEFNNTLTSADFKALASNSSAHKDAGFWSEALKSLKKDGFVDIQTSHGTYRIAKTDATVKMLENYTKGIKLLANDASKFAATRLSTIKKMAFRKDMAADVEAYTGTARNNRIGRLWDIYKPTKADFKWYTPITAPIKWGMQAMKIPFEPWNWAQKSAASSFYKIESTVLPVYEADMMMQLLGMGAKPLTMAVPAQDEKGQAIVDANGQPMMQEIAITHDLVSQLEASQAQYDNAIKEMNDKIYKLKTSA